MMTSTRMELRYLRQKEQKLTIRVALIEGLRLGLLAFLAVLLLLALLGWAHDGKASEPIADSSHEL